MALVALRKMELLVLEGKEKEKSKETHTNAWGRYWEEKRKQGKRGSKSTHKNIIVAGC